MGKKICFTSNSLYDLLNFRGEIIKAFLERGDMVTIIIPEDKNVNPLEFDSRIDVKYINFSRKSKNPFNDIQLLKSLAEEYKKNKFDKIFHYTIKPNIYGNIAAKLSKSSSISIIPGLGHVFINENFSTKIVEKLYKFSLKFAKEVWFLNEDDKNEFLKRRIIDNSKAVVIPGEGINLNNFKPMKKEHKDEKIVFLMIARVLWEKGYREYVEAAKIIKEKYHNVEFQLLGKIDEGNPSGVPRELIERDVESKIINYLGTTKDVKNIIKEIDCLVLPSYYREGIPRTLMEGAAMEKILITTNNVGCKEVVRDGYNGYLCEVKNGIDLADKIEKVLELSLEKRREMGRNGRKYVDERFDIEKIKQKYLVKL